MGKSLLTREELLDLDRTLIEMYSFFRDLRSKSPTAQWIHYPSVPAEFGESLTIYCVENFFGKGWTARLGTKRDESDVVLERLGEQRTVEVKTTGQTSFQEFKPKDLAADFLVWMDFGDRYIKGSGKLDIYILRNPGVYFSNPLRLKLHDFFKRTEGCQDLKHIEVQSLRDLLNFDSLPLKCC